MRSLGAVGVLFTLLIGTGHADAQTVVIDPGHGGGDPGAVGCSLQEADVVLDVSTQAGELLRDAGITVHLTRTDDRFIELGARSSFANSRGADRFVSVHANANEGTPATGTETFVYTSPSAASVTLGQAVQDDLIATWGLRDRGLKMANFSVIRNTTMPAALAELAFINRCDPDAGLLGSPAERSRIAAALARAILASLGRTDPIEPMTTGRLLGVSFEDTGAGLEDTTNRIPGARIQVGDEVQTSGADGLFMYNLDPGTYQVQVSMDGFTPAMRECVVSAGADTWCSVGLSPGTAATTTRVVGFVFEDNGEGMMTAPRLSGALVDIGGMSATTDDEGNFEFEVEPGEVTLNVSKEGYVSAARACAVSGAETWCYVGLVPDTAEPVGNGTLQGVVFVGDDLNRRVEEANVVIRELGTTVQSALMSGFWRLELPAGTYTVDIEAPGYISASEPCTVVEGEEAWCNIGLMPDGDGGASVIDERTPEEVARGVDPITTSGCSAGGTSSESTLFWMLGLLALLFVRRRGLHAGRAVADGAAAVALLTLAGCSGAPEAAPEAVSAQANLETALARDGELLLAAEVAAFVTLEDVHEVAQGDFVDLELSPDARHIALSHARFEALSVLSVELPVSPISPRDPNAAGAHQLREIRRAPQAGYQPRWSDDGQALGVRIPGQTSTAAPMLAYALDGTEVAPFQPTRALSVRVEDDVVVMRTADGDETRLGPPGDRYFEPRVSADGEFVSFRGLSTGLYVHRRADGATFMVGAGDHARFDAAGRWMVFARGVEDGHERTSATLYVMDLSSDALRYGPIETNAVRPDAPSIADGKLAFMDEGSARIGELRFED